MGAYRATRQSRGLGMISTWCSARRSGPAMPIRYRAASGSVLLRGPDARAGGGSARLACGDGSDPLDEGPGAAAQSVVEPGVGPDDRAAGLSGWRRGDGRVDPDGAGRRDGPRCSRSTRRAGQSADGPGVGGGCPGGEEGLKMMSLTRWNAGGVLRCFPIRVARGRSGLRHGRGQAADQGGRPPGAGGRCGPGGSGGRAARMIEHGIPRPPRGGRDGPICGRRG